MIKIRSSSCHVLILLMIMNSLILVLGHSDENSLEENFLEEDSLQEDSNGQTSSLQRNKRFVVITKSIQPLTFFWPIRKRCCCPPMSMTPATMAPTLPPPPAGNASESPPPAEGGGANMTEPLILEVETDVKQQSSRSAMTTCRCSQRQNRVQQVVSEKTAVKKSIMLSTAADPVFRKAARKLRGQESVRENDPPAVKQSKFKMRMRSSLSRRISPARFSSSTSAKSETVTRSLVKTLPITNNRAAASLKMRKRMMVSGTGTTDTPKTRFFSSSFSPHSSTTSSLLSTSVPRKSSKKRSCIMYLGTLMCR